MKTIYNSSWRGVIVDMRYIVDDSNKGYQNSFHMHYLSVRIFPNLNMKGDVIFISQPPG